MKRDAIYQRLVQMLETEKGADFAISPELPLTSLAEDSVEMMELILDLEDAFALEIRDEEIDQFVTLADILDFLEKKLK